MVAAFGTTKPRKHDPRWITNYPRLDRRTLARNGALQPGMRTNWRLKGPLGVASSVHIACTALTDGLEITTGDQVQVVRYRYDTVPCGNLRQFFCCPSCERVCRTLYYDRHWGCRVCVKLIYPSRSPGRIAVACRIDEMRRSLIGVRPGSQQWKHLLAQITEHHAILSANVARVRRDLRRRLHNDYKRKPGENPVRADGKSPPRSGGGKPD
jgi:hypothetical protein